MKAIVWKPIQKPDLDLQPLISAKLHWLAERYVLGGYPTIIIEIRERNGLDSDHQDKEAKR